jgi:sugar phosphate isomerase/epimerase
VKLGIGTYAAMWAIGGQLNPSGGGRAARPARSMTAFDLLRRTHELGLHVVQYGPNLPLAALPERELAALVEQAAAWDIELELGTRGLEADHLRSQIALARRIGARLLRTVPEVGGVTPPRAALPEHLRIILPDLEAAGASGGAGSALRLGLENGLIPARDLAWALDQIGSPRLGVVLDMVNSLAVSEGWRYVTELLAPYTVCLHHKDFAVQRAWHMMGFVVEGRPAGQGQLDTGWLLDTLNAAEAQYNVILEVWPPEQPSLEATIALEARWVDESITYLRRFVAG